MRSCVVCVLLGCASHAPVPPPARVDAIVAEAAIEARPDGLEAVHVRCETAAECPTSVALVVGPLDAIGPDGQPNRCTGSLVGPDLLLTASHCLPEAARHAHASCRGTWVAFPAVRGAREEWVECERVEIAEAVDDHAVMRPDVAVVRVARSIGRTPLAIDPSPPEPFAIVSIASVTPHPIYRTQHVLGTRLCRVRTTDEATAIFGGDASRVGWLSDCPTYDGNSGAPLIDYQGRVRGILHGGSNPWFGIGVTTPPPAL